jgi:hypothetical protein
MARVGDRSRLRTVVAVTTYSRPEKVTFRDRQVLAFAVEMFGLPLPILAGMVPGDRVARRIVGRLEGAHLARRVRVAGQRWLVPTARGIEATGLGYDVWAPAGWKLEHHATVIGLRLSLERDYPDAVWISERAIRRRLRQEGSRGRRADGALRWSDGTATAIEVELSVKAKRQPGVLSGPDRYGDIVRQVDPTWNAGVWWFTPARHVDRLAKRLAEVGGGEVHQVYPLPEGVAR